MFRIKERPGAVDRCVQAAAIQRILDRANGLRVLRAKVRLPSRLEATCQCGQRSDVATGLGGEGGGEYCCHEEEQGDDWMCASLVLVRFAGADAGADAGEEDAVAGACAG
jgi:hypothetical protein